MIHRDVMYPVFPCTINVTVFCTQRNLDPIVRAFPVKKYFWNYLDGFPGVFSARTLSPQTDSKDCLPRRPREARLTPIDRDGRH